MYSPGGPDKPALFLFWSIVLFAIGTGALVVGLAEHPVPALAVAGLSYFGAVGFAVQVVRRRGRGQGWNES